MRIYTRTGDDGSTSLFGGSRVSKIHPRLMAYGTLDELNCAVGILRIQAPQATSEDALKRIQHDLFVLGALLATPPDKMDRLEQKMSRPTWSPEDMEKDIDRLTELAPPMRSFVLPGGCPASAHAHWARTVCRRAEREVVSLAQQEPIQDEVIVYLNRLSDWFFALARAENALSNTGDTEWKPI